MRRSRRYSLPVGEVVTTRGGPDDEANVEPAVAGVVVPGADRGYRRAVRRLTPCGCGDTVVADYPVTADLTPATCLTRSHRPWSSGTG